MAWKATVPGTALLFLVGTALAADDLPTAWRTGIATNYGSAYDKMVSALACSRSVAIVATDFSLRVAN